MGRHWPLSPMNAFLSADRLELATPAFRLKAEDSREV
jgi:hypothetical protein